MVEGSLQQFLDKRGAKKLIFKLRRRESACLHGLQRSIETDPALADCRARESRFFDRDLDCFIRSVENANDTAAISASVFRQQHYPVDRVRANRNALSPAQADSISRLVDLRARLFMRAGVRPQRLGPSVMQSPAAAGGRPYVEPKPPGRAERNRVSESCPGGCGILPAKLCYVGDQHRQVLGAGRQDVRLVGKSETRRADTGNASRHHKPSSNSRDSIRG